jgi:hypothetical protein
MFKRWITGILFCLLLGVGAASAQDGGSSLQAWADTPGNAINLTPQMSAPRFWRTIGAINTYTSTGDPVLSCASSGYAYSLWASFVAPQTSIISVSAFGSNYDTVIGLFKTTATTQAQCDNDSAFTATETMTFKMVAGTRYYLMFAAAGTGTGVDSTSFLDIVVTTNASLSKPFKIPASGSYSTMQTDIEYAFSTSQSFGGSCGSGNYLVFYSFKPAVSGRYEISTLGSNYDTVLGYAEDLTILGCNQDINTDNVNSRMRPILTAGHTYLFFVGQAVGGPNTLDHNLVMSLQVRKM